MYLINSIMKYSVCAKHKWPVALVETECRDLGSSSLSTVLSSFVAVPCRWVSYCRPDCI